MSEREKTAREMYAADLYRSGYVPTPSEGERYWDQLPVSQKAVYRRRAANVNRIVRDAIINIRRSALSIPDPSRALPSGEPTQ